MKRLVLLTVVLLLAVPAFAQVSFTASALPRQMRGEGITETAGNVVLVAANTGTIGAGTSIQITYSAPITVKPDVTNLLLFTTGGAPAALPAGVTATASGNTVTIAFGSATSITAGDVFQITQLRLDVSAFSAGTQITATLTGTGAPAANPVSFTNISVVVGIVVKPSMTSVGFITPSSSTTAINAAPFALSTCAAANSTQRIVIREAFAQAFTSFLDEKAFTPNDAVTNGTIFQVTLHGLPSGVTETLKATLIPTGSTLTGTLPAAGANEIAVVTTPASGKDLTKDANITALIGATANTVTTSSTINGADFTFFVFFGATDVTVQEDLVLDFTTAVSQTTLATSPTLTVDVTLVPGPTTGTGLSPVVRFAPTTLATGLALGTIGPCQSALLFPFVVTGLAGFDTSIAISNTTKDVFGAGVTATPGAGTCTLTIFPTPDPSNPGTVGTPATFTTPSIASGGTFAASLGSNTALTGLEGYMFATCNFLNVHGFAFITNGFGTGTQTLNQAYLPLVVPTTTKRAGEQPESLGQ